MAKTLQEIFNPHATSVTQPTATKSQKSLDEIFGRNAPAATGQATAPTAAPTPATAPTVAPGAAPMAAPAPITPTAPTAKRSLDEIFNKPAETAAPEDGGFSGFAKDVIRSTGIPKFGVAAYNTGKAALDIITGNGDKAAEDLRASRDLPFIGRTDPALNGDETFTQGAKKIIGTGLEIGSTVAGGEGAAGAAQAGFKGLTKQGLKTAAKEGTAMAFAQGTGSALNEDKSVVESVGRGLAYAPLGAAAGLAAPVATVALKGAVKPITKLAAKVFSPIEKKAEVAITEGIEKGIKPYFSSTAKPGVREAYMERASEAIKTINEYRPKITGEDGIDVVRNPENRRELLEALDQAKGKLFEEYDTIAKQAGEAGAQFDAAPAVSKLQKISQDISYNPQIREYAAKLVTEIGELQGQAPKVIQERIKDLNQQLQGFFLGRVDKMKAQVDASVAQLLREQLDNQIEAVGGQGYQALKNKYGALKTIEKDVARQVAVEARKNVKGLVDFTDIFTGGDLIGGIATMNPALFARGLAGKGIKEYIKFINDPNRYIKNMFKAVEKLPIKKLESGISRPPIAGLLPEPPIIPPYTPKTVPDASRVYTQAEAKLRDPKLFAADRKALPPESGTVFVPPKTSAGDVNARIQPAGQTYEYNNKGELQTVYDKSFRMNQEPTAKQVKQAAGLYKPPSAYFGTKAEREAAQTVPYPANVVEGKVIDKQTTSQPLKALKKMPVPKAADTMPANKQTYTDSLAQEAKKYKNVEDFIKSYGKPFYHGTDKKNLASFEKNGFDISKNAKGFAESPYALFVAPDQKTASMYGKTVEVYPVQEIKVLDVSSQEWADTMGKSRSSEESARIAKELKNRGYDLIEGGNEQTILSPDKFKTKNQLIEIYNKNKSITRPPKDVAVTPYKDTGKLTTKILKDLEGKTTVSKQYILDATNRGELKQAERDITRQVLETMPDGPVNVADFAKKVKSELLPLKVLQKQDASRPLEKQIKTIKDEIKKATGKDADRASYEASVLGNPSNYSDDVLKKIDEYAELQSKYEKMGDENFGTNPTQYENISLPAEIRGKVKNYKENIYESPIETSAGITHFNNSGTKNYFGHSRIEDMADGKTRRVIEVQSDLYQKGNLDKESTVGIDYKKYGSSKNEDDPAFYPEGLKNDLSKRKQELYKLQQYNDPTAHFRMIREEVKTAAKDGKEQLLFPTGETAMKIEGLSDTGQFIVSDVKGSVLTTENMVRGMDLSRNQENWIITEVLPGGKFKAVNAYQAEKALDEKFGMSLPPGHIYDEKTLSKIAEAVPANVAETFDTSGKLDTNNPIYKFYEKEVGKYLKNKYGAELITDDKGVKWWKVPLKKDYGKGPVEAFGIVGLGAGTGLGAIKRPPEKEKK